MKRFIKNTICISLLLITVQLNSYAQDNIKEGNSHLYKAAISMNKSEKDYYVQKALEIYSQEYEKNDLNIAAMVGLGKTYTLLDEKSKAKTILMKAYSINPTLPEIHTALGEYLYFYQEYNAALEFFKLALSSGHLKNYTTNLSTAMCYERLGDIPNALLYYKITLSLNPNSNLAKDRILKIENSLKSQYTSVPAVFQEDDSD